MISGLIILYMGYRAMKHNAKHEQENLEEKLEKKEIKAHPVLTGFIINFTNPMTHFFWLTLSSTVIRVWHSAGTLPYLTFAVAMLSGMFLSLFGLNFLASKGRRMTTPKLSGKLSSLLAYAIAAFGIGFCVYGLFVLYRYIW
jgi:threonine/homoserine/homoserine lactone efflux protein